MRFYGLKTCDTCRKAVKVLLAAGHEVEVIDVRGDGVPKDDLERFFNAFGSDLVNRRSTTWRGLSEEERRDDPVSLLLRHPTLMKRPIIDADQLYLGWDATVQAKFV